MTTAALRIITRVVKRRYDAGEDIDIILADYPKLSDKEREAIRAEVVPEMNKESKTDDISDISSDNETIDENIAD